MTLDILLPFYGDVGYLKLAVGSILSQTDEDWRLMVVDDGYPDPEVARWFSGLGHPRVRYTRNPTNLGANRNYRHALSMASADWVVVMGADDVMLPSYVEEVKKLAVAHPRAAVIQPGVEVIDGDGRVVRPLADRVKTRLAPRAGGVTELAGETLSASLLRANWTYFPSLCWRRALVTTIGFRRGLDVVQDLALLLDVAAGGGTLARGTDVVFGYRRHRDSDSTLRAVAGSRFAEERAFFRSVADEAGSRGWPRAARAARWHLTSRLNALSLMPSTLRNGSWSSAAQLLRHAITS